MLNSIKKQVQYIGKELKDMYSEQEAANIIEETNVEFEKLLPHLPYIGGRENLLTKQIVGVAPYLSFYRVMKKREMPVKEIGRIIYDSAAKFWSSYPKIIGIFVRIYFKSKSYFNKTLKAGAIKSQNRKYPNDFVYSAIDGNGTDFDYGIDYTECGICKFFHEQDADELIPYMCLIDFAESDALKMGLERTMTIADGHNICDFRFKIGKTVKRNITSYFN